MTTLRRILTGSTLAIMACGLASANPITYQVVYGVDPATGNETVTQIATLSPVDLNIISPSSLFSFSSFAALGIANATYVAGDSTFDYEFTNNVSTFKVTNNAGSTESVNASVSSQLNVDSSTNMATGDQSTANTDLGFTANQLDKQLASTPSGGKTLTNNQTYTDNSLVPYTDGIGYNACGSFGNTEDSSGCNEQIGDSEAASGFTYGLTDTQTFGESINGSGPLNLTIVATTTYSAEAEVTYEYQVSGAPEPATMALMGGALIGLGLLGKRLRRS